MGCYKDGVLVDYQVIVQDRRDAQREQAAEKKRAAELRKKGKQARPNYNDMANADYILVRRKDWYSEVECDHGLLDQSFWCAEQEYIYKDVYATLSKPIRPMSATNLDHLSKQEYWSEAYDILDKLGLLPLMTVQCDYNPQLILQFYATVVFCNDEPTTLKWMSGPEYCETTWVRFSQILGYTIGQV